MAKSLKDLGTDTVCILNYPAGRRGAYTPHTRWIYIISTAQMLSLQSRKPCPPSGNCMLPGSSNAYVAPSCQAANASEIHVHILTLLGPSSASPTSSPTTSRKSTPSKLPQTRSSRQPTKATTTPWLATPKPSSFPYSASLTSTSTPTHPSLAVSSPRRPRSCEPTKPRVVSARRLSLGTCTTSFTANPLCMTGWMIGA